MATTLALLVVLGLFTISLTYGYPGKATYNDHLKEENDNDLLLKNHRFPQGRTISSAQGENQLDRKTPMSSVSTIAPSAATSILSSIAPQAVSGRTRTVIFIRKSTGYGQNLFVRGGIDHNRRTGCDRDAQTSACALDIETVQLGRTLHYSAYNAWREGDTKLDWYGAQTGQGRFRNISPEGTPCVWTTNQRRLPGYQALNRWGTHYWMVELYVNDSQTENGWFEIKGYLDGMWETDIAQDRSCSGSAGVQTPYRSRNHLAKAGYINVFTWGSSTCLVDSFPQ